MSSENRTHINHLLKILFNFIYTRENTFQRRVKRISYYTNSLSLSITGMLLVAV